MKRAWKTYQRIFYIGIIVIVFGVIMSTTMSESLGGLGTIFIAIGALLFMSAMHRKNREKKSEV